MVTTVSRRVRPTRKASTEVATRLPWPIADIKTLAERADCTEGRTVAALYYAREYLREEKGHE